MADFTQEIKRLQKLSCISLTPEQEQKIWTQLPDIIGFLGQLPQLDDSNISSKIENTNKLTLRTIAKKQEKQDTSKLLNNVHHPIINNSIVIKSVLS